MTVIYRREVLDRDEPVDFRHALATIRNLSGWGTSDLAFVLNVARSTLNSWERDGCRPNHDDGRAVLKLLELCRNSDT